MPLVKARCPETDGVKHRAVAAAPHRLFLSHSQHVGTDLVAAQLHRERETMRCLAMTAGAVCFTLLASTVGFAQVPPDPTNPNENIPEAMTQPMYGEPISIETAKKTGSQDDVVSQAGVAALQ
jgi:hypothetical protein